MRKRAVTLFLSAALLCGVFTVAATGGTATDPLISKRHADGAFTTQTVTKAEARIAKGHDTLYEAALAKVTAQRAATAALLGGEGTYNAAFADMRLKKGDVVQVSTGSGFLLLAGEAAVSYPTGAVVDVSGGAVRSQGLLSPGKRYLVAENTTASVTVTSPTAVLSLEGHYAVTASAATDYNALAGALKTLGLLKGSDTGYGAGYDLELPPTRIQGLIMFLRMLGEEDEALATAAVHPFQDVPAWCRPYVAYAYDKGYTKGVDSAAMLFGTDGLMAAADFMTFVLRALGYAEGGAAPDFTWSTALDSAQRLGVITAGEHQLLKEQTFLRAQTVYVSYFALDAAYKGSGDTLLDRLISGGTLDRVIAESVRNGVAVSRIH